VTSYIIYMTLSKAKLRLVNLNNEAVCKLCFPLTHQDKKLSKDFFQKVFKMECLHHVVCISTSDWLN